MLVYISALIDFFLGDPKGFPHPIILVGKLIALYEKFFYRGNLKFMGFLFTAAILLTVGMALWLVLWLASHWQIVYWIVSVYLMYTALAWRSLKKETGYVFAALSRQNLPLARKKLSYVVGRDTENLDEEKIAKATIETFGENIIDGVLAPMFYMMIGYFLGWPAIFVYIYKTINTLDSMVGYKNDRYADFGFCSAKLDDVVNWIPSRLGSLLMLAAGTVLGYDGKNGFRIWKRDRYAHKSPNSAQSESVIAGLLGLQLGGSNYYFGELVVKPTIGDELRKPTAGDYLRCCKILDVSVLFTLLIFTVCYVISILV